MLSVNFLYFALHKIFYPIGRRCNSTFCVATSAGVYIGSIVKMLKNTVHQGLILWKVSINDKDNYKTVTKNTTYMFLSLYNYFPFRIQCSETVSVFMYAIQKPATEKFCEGIKDQ